MDRLLFAACLGLSAAAAVATLRLAGDRFTVATGLGVATSVAWLALALWTADDDSGDGSSTPEV